MKHNPCWGRHLGLPAFAFLAASLPGLAQAQFILTEQSAAVFASSSAGTPVQRSSAAGDLSNLSMLVTSGPSTGTYAGANVQTTVSSDRLAFETYTWATSKVAGVGSNGAPFYGSAASSTTLNMAFSVVTSTDVVMDVSDLYRPSNVKDMFPTLSSSLSFEKLSSDGTWVAVLPRDALDRGSPADGVSLDGVNHLEAGQYRLNAVFNYASSRPDSALNGAGAKVSISAVPEPSTHALMGLGLACTMLLVRRRQAQQG